MMFQLAGTVQTFLANRVRARRKASKAKPLFEHFQANLAAKERREHNR